MTDELTTRLQSSTSEVSLTDEVKAAHLSAISEALAGAPLAGAPVVPLDRVSRRRRVIAAVTAAALIGPTGLAAASGDALPGEPLYGVKQVSEQVTSLFDSEVIARHRIEEAEALAMLGRRSDDAIKRAADAVAGLPEDHALRQRLAALAADRDDDDPEQDRDRDRVVQPDPADEDDTSDDGATADDVIEDAEQPDDSDDLDDDSGDGDDDDGDGLNGGDDGDDVTEDAGQPDDSDDLDDDSDDGDDDDGDDDDGD